MKVAATANDVLTNLGTSSGISALSATTLNEAMSFTYIAIICTLVGVSRHECALEGRRGGAN